MPPYGSFNASTLLHARSLEDFEDGKLNTPGVHTNQRCVVIGNLGHKTRFVDSVDEDDGQLDGSGSYGHSLWSDNNSSLSFIFNEKILGTLPTHVGLVWTDAPFAVVSLSAFNHQGDLIGQTNPLKLGDHSMTGTVTEDCFLGVHYKEGISKVVINNRY